MAQMQAVMASCQVDAMQPRHLCPAVATCEWPIQGASLKLEEHFLWPVCQRHSPF
jgi:hypothetical protein